MKFIFLGSGRCFHTEDWYQCAKKLSKERDDLTVAFVSDQFDGEGFKTFLNESDNVYTLFNIDTFLPNGVSALSNKWRNFLKLFLLPLQVLKLRQVLRKFGKDDVIIHAHSTYYAFLASFSPVPYISTPQGSEVLVRLKSKAYKAMAKRAHSKAYLVTVDSSSMASTMNSIIGIRPTIIQNGIQVNKFFTFNDTKKDKIISIRGIAPNYRIEQILSECENLTAPKVSVCAPFIENDYFDKIKTSLFAHTDFLGKLTREEFHEQIKAAKYVISIPTSDSSPRSVYEAIFCGAIAICSPNNYLSELPESMRARVIVVDIEKTGWLENAISAGEILHEHKFQPCSKALMLYDQKESMKKIIHLVQRTHNV